jgi:hypothetical protein
MLVLKVPYNEDVKQILWPAFKVSIEDKHGDSGSQGLRGEQNAIALAKEHLTFPICYDHSEDVVGQLFGIDLTLVGTGSFITVDVKSGRSSLYWNKADKYWFVTVKKSYFDKRKKNTHIMHIGPKGDLFVMYRKDDLLNAIKDDKVVYTEQDENTWRVHVDSIKYLSKHNFGK